MTFFLSEQFHFWVNYSFKTMFPECDLVLFHWEICF